MPKIAVIGAGITGITTAASLLERGYDVHVFDRHRYPAMETSFANGGQLSASNAETWNRWWTVMKGIKWMLTRGAPLLVNPMPSWHKYSWMAEFIGAIPHYEKNTVETVRMAIAAREVLHAKAKRYGVEFDCEKRGILHTYTNKADFDHAMTVNKLLKEGGLERRPVTPEEFKQIEPALNSGDFYGGFYTESDFSGDIHNYTEGLAYALKAAGVRLCLGAEVIKVNAGDGEVRITWNRIKNVAAADDISDEVAGNAAMETFDAVVVCAGVHSRSIAARLGDRVNVYPVKGYSITIMLNDEQSRAAAPWVSFVDDATKIVTSRLGAGRFRIAGTAEFNGYNYDIRDDRIRPLIAWSENYFPGVSTEHAIPWAGLRPMMPNMLPRVGQGKRARVFYNTGHGHLGWTLSAVTAEMVADAVKMSKTVN